MSDTMVGVYTLPKGGLYGGPFDSSHLDPNVQAVMMNHRWTTSAGGDVAATTITYAFPTSTEDYLDVAGGYPDRDNLDGFAPVTDIQKAAIRAAFGLVSSYTNLSFVEIESGLAQDAAFRFARYGESGSESNFPANADESYAPSDSRSAGDTYLGGNGTPPTAAFFGTDHFNTIIHEMGHAFGLKHGHDDEFGGKLTDDRNDNEFSVMTYASYLGADADSGASEAWVGSSPQSYMMYDIAALQAYYGANFSRVGTEAVYTWDAVTGQQYINGVAAPNTGASETGKILTTVWTQGATATYDLSNFSEDQLADLRPGQWLQFSSAQIADLNNQAPEGTDAYEAKGNVYNALLYQGDTRSLVGNVITGSGSDVIIGNEAGNRISAGAGNDFINAGAGNDIISGGAGADLITFGAGRNLLRDVLSDLHGDVVMDLGQHNAVQILGIRAARGDFTIQPGQDSSLVSLHESTFELRGDFSAGNFVAMARHAGDDAYTHLSFVAYLPELAEHARVDGALINGIADEVLLSGDGMTNFSVTLQSSHSGYSNMIGTYRIGADGSISDVTLLFQNTVDPMAVGRSVDLGQPEAAESIGFFLVQNGFAIYGGLADDLSFIGGADAGWTLHSASRGALTDAAVFHATADFNPGDSVQVLSGLQPGSEALWIGFEDLTGPVSDWDYQDVVLSVLYTDMYLG
ncbi:M10 family metallopeptidase [Neoroseomonas soli]|uniref:DUF4114 domain-containing protein n=1 Tax=Neoroseomonas soli TaxID=1081025 RepID=A0A9X9WSH7_9PROT|nr:M10 family metallopeptidase [Neoroseomonas soli]MBR0670106.1 DUF4114 domain-containing protein [Neoroseomonas soli]